ncbi:MAG TPA: SpoIIE family protein phosphatase [Stellaceae bacterium]|nr:SpoIIE family protein phosphatase [Stellaceae bacterium]
MPAPGAALLDHAVAARGLSKDVSGDLSLVRPTRTGLLMAAIDGLGHGAEAAEAAAAAAAVLESEPDRPAARLVERCHAALLRTRGAAMTLAVLDADVSAMTWLAIGNVEGLLLRAGRNGAEERIYVLPCGGIVGYRLPPLKAATIPLRPGDLLLFATDGIREGFETTVDRDATPHEIANRILDRHGKGTDDALVLVGRWHGGGGPRP